MSSPAALSAARSALKAGPLCGAAHSARLSNCQPPQRCPRWPGTGAGSPALARRGAQGRGLATRAAKQRGQQPRRAEARHRARRGCCTYAANRRGPCPGATVKAAALAALALALTGARARATASARQQRRKPLSDKGGGGRPRAPIPDRWNSGPGGAAPAAHRAAGQGGPRSGHCGGRWLLQRSRGSPPH